MTMDLIDFIICMTEILLFIGISAGIYWLIERFYGMERLERKIKELFGIYDE